MDLSNKTNKEIINLVQASDDKDTVREVAEFLKLSFSGNTGIDTLKQKIYDTITVEEDEDQMDLDLNQEDEDDEDEDSSIDPTLLAALQAHRNEKAAAPVHKKNNGLPPLGELIHMNERKHGIPEPLKRAIVRAKALRLVRVRISNLDPNDASVPGSIISVYNKYTGKVSKYIPFGEENEVGYHVPQILLDELKSRTFNMRKEIKQKGSNFGVKQYKTVQMKKFSIEKLPPLTKEDLKHLADDQKARNAIDQAA